MDLNNNQTNENKNHKNIMLCGVALLTILAIGGIGFGIWAVINGNTKEKNLNEQISSLNSQVSDLTDQLNTVGPSAKDEEVIEEITTEEAVTSNQNSTDYLYIGEWGIKIKIPEALKGNMSYAFDGTFLSIADGPGLGGFSASIDYQKNSVLQIVRGPEGTYDNCMAECPSQVNTLNGYDYGYRISGSNLDAMKSSALNQMKELESLSEI